MANPLYANRRARVIENVVTNIRRQLPSVGKIFVKEGQQVTPADIVAQSTTSAGFRTVNLAKLLSVPAKEGKKFLQRQTGQRIYKGELLAFKKGSLFQSQKIVTSPTDAVIDSYNEANGELRLSFLPYTTSLPAAVFGVVQKVDQALGEIIIKTEVTEIFGVLGSGKTREGVLKVIGASADLTDKSRINNLLADHILVTGSLFYSGALMRAISVGVKGIISGGINASDYKSISSGSLTTDRRFGTDIGIALLICEGFGSIPIGDDIYQILLKYNNRFAILDGNRGKLMLPSCESDCLVKINKVALPQQANMVESLPELEAVTLQPGLKVRVIGTSGFGYQGQILAIDQTPTLLQSGVNTYLVNIKTPTRVLRVPYTNLEVI